jgi:hypothetical protein
MRGNKAINESVEYRMLQLSFMPVYAGLPTKYGTSLQKFYTETGTVLWKTN